MSYTDLTTPAPPASITSVYVRASRDGATPYRVTLDADGQALTCDCPSSVYRPSVVCKHRRAAEAGRFVPAGICPSCGILRDLCLAEAMVVPDGTLRHLLDSCRKNCGAAGGWGLTA